LLPGANALQASIDAISKYGGARAGYRTMLDALIPASETLREVGSYCIYRFYYVGKYQHSPKKSFLLSRDLKLGMTLLMHSLYHLKLL
jgi:hypothetical protein